MLDFTYKLTTIVNNKAVDNKTSGLVDVNIDCKDNRLTVTLNPKSKVELSTFEMTAPNIQGDKDKAFCNGYQAWTVSREFTKKEKMHGIRGLYKLLGLKKMVGISGDYNFVDYTSKPGDYHSHTYTYIKHEDHSIELYGSLSEAMAFTIFKYSARANTFKVVKDVEGMIIDKPVVILDMVYIKGNYDECFDKYFAITGLPKPRISGLKGYTSWYNYFQNINEEIILRDLKGLSDANVGANIFQIDDGYQEYVGDFMRVNKQKFPRGMKFVADEIHNKGLLAGLWLAPFNAEKKSKTFREHPDWLVKNSKGKPIFSVFAWSHAYTLDIYNPDARAYMKEQLRTVTQDWGFDMVKLDFLYSQCMYPRLGKSRGMIMREAMEFLREAIGEKTLLLGCGVPLGSGFGIMDACRISCDVDLKFKFRPLYRIVNNEIISAKNAMTNSVFRRHLSGRVIANDPDVFFLRKDNLVYTDEQKLTLLTINNLFGDILFVSDNVGDYDEKQLALLKRAYDKKDVKFLDCDQIDVAHIKVTTPDGETIYNIGK